MAASTTRRIQQVAGSAALLLALIWLYSTMGFNVQPYISYAMEQYHVHVQYSWDPKEETIQSSTNATLTKATYAMPPADPAGAIRVCTLIRNKAPYVREWVAFHRLQGFSAFTIYDDFSTDNLYEELEPFTSAGIVEIISLPILINLTLSESLSYSGLPFSEQIRQEIPFCKGNHDKHDLFVRCQRALNSDCVARSQLSGTPWLGIFDIDEFFFRPPMYNDTLAEFLRQTSQEVSQYMVRGIPFGPAEDTNSTGLVTMRHTRHPFLNKYGAPSSHSLTLKASIEALKSIIRPQMLRPELASVHFQKVHGLSRRHPGFISKAQIRLNHYQFQSIDDAFALIQQNFDPEMDQDQFTNPAELLNFLSAAEDTAATVFGPRVLECMSRTQQNMFDTQCTQYHIV